MIMVSIQVNGSRSCAIRAGFIIAICSALAVTAGAQGRTGPGGLHACNLLVDVLGVQALGFRPNYRSSGSHWLSCEYTDIPPGQNLLDAQFRAGFGFVPYRSIAEAQQNWQQTYSKWQGETSQSASSSFSVSRLRGYGADDAFIVEETRRDPQPGAREAMVYWRKGRWVGTLQLRAPLSSHFADVESAEGIMKRINWVAFGK